MNSLTKLKTCVHCGQTGFVWWRVLKGTSKGKYTLCKPKPGTTEPNPNAIHFCPVKQTMKAVSRMNGRSR